MYEKVNSKKQDRKGHTFMSLIPRVRCKRCDRSFSGLKNKCPHCNTNRGRSGKRAFDANDAFARRMIKILLLVALVITVISVLVMNLDDADNLADETPSSPPDTIQIAPGGPLANLPPVPSPETIQTQAPTIEATSVQIAWQFWSPGTNEFSLRAGQSLELWANIFPIEAEDAIHWTIENNTVALITQDADNHARITLEARGRGVTTLQVTVGNLTDEVTVRVN